MNSNTFEELLTRVNNATVQLGRHKASRFAALLLINSARIALAYPEIH